MKGKFKATIPLLPQKEWWPFLKEVQLFALTASTKEILEWGGSIETLKSTTDLSFLDPERFEFLMDFHGWPRLRIWSNKCWRTGDPNYVVFNILQIVTKSCVVLKYSDDICTFLYPDFNPMLSKEDKSKITWNRVL